MPTARRSASSSSPDSAGQSHRRRAGPSVAGAARRSFELLDETGVFEVVFPEIAKDYARDTQARGLMLDLLERMDEERANSRREIRTGEVTMPPCAEALATHRVELCGDRVRIEVTR